MKALVTGAGGMLARAVRIELERRGHAVAARNRHGLDVTDAPAVGHAMEAVEPDVVVHCAAYTRVDDAEREEAQAFALNAVSAETVARACRRHGARMLYPSTDYVFGGNATRPYAPDDPTNPINAYGRSKQAGESLARVAGDAIVVRTSWLYGAGGRNFVATVLVRARAGDRLRIVDDQRGSPTWTRSLAATLVGVLEADAAPGIYHAANHGETTWYGLAHEALRLAGVEAAIEPVRSAWSAGTARRPRYSVLDCAATEKLVGPMGDWREALAAAIEEGV